MEAIFVILLFWLLSARNPIILFLGLFWAAVLCFLL